MTGSVIDGEDVVQEALVKALDALPHAGTLANPEGWLFRIVHNAALDFLRRRVRHAAVFADDEDLEMIADPTDPGRDADATVASLRTFMRLPIVQRSAVILVDVLGYTLADLSEVAGGSILKSALQRGRARLRELAREPDAVAQPALTAVERARADVVDRAIVQGRADIPPALGNSRKPPTRQVGPPQAPWHRSSIWAFCEPCTFLAGHFKRLYNLFGCNWGAREYDDASNCRASAQTRERASTP